jgi:hypothetical protein
VAGIFTQIIPECIGELETRPKTSRISWLWPHIFILSGNFCLAMSATALKFFLFSYVENKLFLIAAIYISIGVGSFVFIFSFYSVLKWFLFGFKNYFLFAVGDRAKKYKLEIFKPNPSKFFSFWPSSFLNNSHRSDLCKNS